MMWWEQLTDYQWLLVAAGQQQYDAQCILYYGDFREIVWW